MKQNLQFRPATIQRKNNDDQQQKINHKALQMKMAANEKWADMQGKDFDSWSAKMNAHINSTGTENANPAQAKLDPVQMFVQEEEKEENKMPKQAKAKSKLLQQKEDDKDEELKQKKAADSKTSSPDSMSGTTTKMPENIQAKMENSFGTNFNNVNIHQNDSGATQMGALAYTQGNDVHFAPGQYNPNTQSGQELLGHELTHVVQQKEGRVSPTRQGKGMSVNDNPDLENEADYNGKLAAAGKETSVNGNGNDIQKKSRKKEDEQAAGTTSNNKKNIGSDHQSKDIKLTIAADKEANMLSKAFLLDKSVGHSWIMLEDSAGLEDSYGFWPANLGNGGGFDPRRPWKNVDGEVRHPDTAHTPNAKFSVQIDAEQLQEGENYAAEKASADYNLLSYNCTTFAREFFKKATGQNAPSGGLLIDNPNSLYNSIEWKNGFKGLNATEEDKSSKKSS